MNAIFYGFVAGLHILVCIILVVVVLLQTGKGADMGAAFGGGSQTVFGSRGPTTFFHYLTTGAAMLFMFTSLFLSCTPSPDRATGTVIDEDGTPTPAATSTESATMGTSGSMAPLTPIAPMTATTAK